MMRGKISKGYTVTQAARLLGCHRNTIINKINKKQITASKPLREWMISPEDIEKYIDSRTVKAVKV